MDAQVPSRGGQRRRSASNRTRLVTIPGRSLLSTPRCVFFPGDLLQTTTPKQEESLMTTGKQSALAATLVFLTSVLLTSSAVYAQDREPGGRAIEFPDIPGYVTLKCDFHMHTVFSDGNVWPSIRVQEALLDGLDAISLTEHLEYQPHQDDIPHLDRNRPYQLALESARNSDLIIVSGSEITRDMPPGHSNSIFITDANMLMSEDATEVFREATRQGGFTFWNHPHWTAQRSDGVATLTDMHLQLIQEGLIHGIEVVNSTTYSDEALQIALDHNLAILGTSDVHGLIDWDFDVPNGGHRPVTLAFATVRSAAGLKEALVQRRTAVWFNNMLIGKEELIRPLVAASLNIKEARYPGETSVLSVAIENRSDAEFMLENRSGYTLHASGDVVILKPHRTTTVQVKTVDRLPSVSLAFGVLNAVTAPNTHPEVVLDIQVGGALGRQR